MSDYNVYPLPPRDKMDNSCQIPLSGLVSSYCPRHPVVCHNEKVYTSPSSLRWKGQIGYTPLSVGCRHSIWNSFLSPVPYRSIKSSKLRRISRPPVTQAQEDFYFWWEKGLYLLWDCEGTLALTFERRGPVSPTGFFRRGLWLRRTTKWIVLASFRSRVASSEDGQWFTTVPVVWDSWGHQRA